MINNVPPQPNLDPVPREAIHREAEQLPSQAPPYRINIDKDFERAVESVGRSVDREIQQAGDWTRTHPGQTEHVVERTAEVRDATDEVLKARKRQSEAPQRVWEEAVEKRDHEQKARQKKRSRTR